MRTSPPWPGSPCCTFLALERHTQHTHSPRAADGLAPHPRTPHEGCAVSAHPCVPVSIGNSPAGLPHIRAVHNPSLRSLLLQQDLRVGVQEVQSNSEWPGELEGEEFRGIPAHVPKIEMLLPACLWKASHPTSKKRYIKAGHSLPCSAPV